MTPPASFQIQKAKNGSDTCSCNGIFLHSSYNPEREAETFVRELKTDFSPECVLIIEPVLSYCLAPLRKRFPQAKLACIRLFSNPALQAGDADWDYVLYASGETAKDAESLYGAFGEETLCSLLATAWTGSSRVWADGVRQAWEAIRQSVVKSRDVLYTRSYFSKRWLKNSVRFAFFLTKSASPVQTDCPVVIAASGPSLKSSLSFLKAYRSRYILIAVSSAYLALTEAGITPDITMSTDGGWWAKAHLAIPGRPLPPLIAGAAEGAFPHGAFSSAIMPLVYADSPSLALYAAGAIPAVPALRNGTVSGTALSFALSLTTGDVYCCGLDLASAQGFQHTQPNALELRACQYDTRVHNAETRACNAQFASSGSLALYRTWFQTHTEQVKQRVFRLSDSYPFTESLAPITDVTWEFFSSKTRQKKSVPQCTCTRIKKRLNQLVTTLQNKLSSDSWDSELFPLESVMVKRGGDSASGYKARIADEKTALQAHLQQHYGQPETVND